MVRCDVSYTGRVQGVFFRATAEQLARDHAVAGWVRNEPDGSVRLVVEGEEDEVERFLDAVGRAKRDNIQDVTVRRCTATGEFNGFSVRR